MVTEAIPQASPPARSPDRPVDPPGHWPHPPQNDQSPVPSLPRCLLLAYLSINQPIARRP